MVIQTPGRYERIPMSCIYNLQMIKITIEDVLIKNLYIYPVEGMEEMVYTLLKLFRTN